LVSALAKFGHTVLGCGRSDGGVRALRDNFPAPHSFAQVDVTDSEAVQKWAVNVLTKFGPPDLLINNAALMNTPAPLWEIPTDEFSSIIDVNIKGIFHVIRAFVPAMVKRKSGVIVNLSSGWGRSTSPEVAPYCATKYAVEGLTLALAQELPPEMAAISLNPGIIDTDMLRQAWAEGASNYRKPDEWAKQAAPFILNLSAKENGRPMTVC
jgi:NAD(P)-dependent dehydrogenase (short-subunit alcohol dehydrogenase family)